MTSCKGANEMTIKILAVGDVVGRPGLDALRALLPVLRKNLELDLIVVNGENANVVGIRPSQAEEIFDSGADVITLGNHTWTRYELRDYMDENSRIIRPANFAPHCPGRGFVSVDTAKGKVLIMNLMGRFTLDTNTDNPFYVADELLRDNACRVVLVDFHAEATSEKLAMAHYLDGRVSALWGTHTHVQTSDVCVYPNGTGYITDLGMTGAKYSVLGIRAEQSVGKFLGDAPTRYDAAPGAYKLEAAVFEIECETGACLSAEAVRFE